MRSLPPVTLFTVVFIVLAAAAAVEQSASVNNDDDNADWVKFKGDHGKVYKDDNDELKHKTAFIKTRQLVNQHNAEYARGQHSFEMGINHLSDLTPEEYRARNGYRQMQWSNNTSTSSASRSLPPMNAANIPDQHDWRANGFVTPVKNQGGCGSCWAFSAVGALEGQHKRATGQLISLSEQNLVDCVTGCNCGGGGMPPAYQYIIDNKGIDTEASYPYTGQNGECKFNKNNIGATETGYIIILPNGDEPALQVALANIGPLSIAINAGLSSFQSYKSGVYYDPACSPNNINHLLLAVGYGTDPVLGDYWLVKNSWGTGWGESGYIRMARNKNNNCGVANGYSYPTL